jgi:hypothetical protein
MNYYDLNMSRRESSSMVKFIFGWVFVSGFLLIFFGGSSTAQVRQIDKQPVRKNLGQDGTLVNWTEPVIETKFDGSERHYLMFEGAVYLDDSSLPHVVTNIKTSGQSTVTADLLNLVFEPLSQ